MTQNERLLFHYCKIGDLSHTKLLVEKEDVNLNIRDVWDSTPLYYACLCGHLELVEYLLENGARCEANSFDGERCMYGALTDQIRNVLRSLKVRVNRLDQYELFLERLYELSPHYDITFEIKDRVFRAHKCILAARSEYFRLKFENQWRKRTWILGTHELLIPEAFESVLKYIYTDRFTTLKLYFDGCLRLAKLFKLNDLLDEFHKKLYTLNINDENEMKNVFIKSKEKQNPALANLNVNGNENEVELTNYDTNADNSTLPIDEADIFLIGKFGANTKLSSTITIEPKDLPLISNSSESLSSNKQSRISLDFRQLAYYALPQFLREQCGPNEGLNLQKIVELTHDLCFSLSETDREHARARNESLLNNIFVHKCFVAERCDYFRTFLHDHFHEITSDDNAPDLKLKRNISYLKLKEISADVLVEVIFFIYSNNFSKEKLDENTLHDVMLVADLYLLPSLKRKCAHELATHYLNRDNLFDLLRISRLYDLKKLEFSCIYFLATNLFDFENSSELKEVILEDARKLKMRQETDTIDIVDDLRYAVNESAMASSLINTTLNKSTLGNGCKSSYERIVDREMRLNLIDKILRDLNLEC